MVALSVSDVGRSGGESGVTMLGGKQSSILEVTVSHSDRGGIISGGRAGPPPVDHRLDSFVVGTAALELRVEPEPRPRVVGAVGADRVGDPVPTADNDQDACGSSERSAGGDVRPHGYSCWYPKFSRWVTRHPGDPSSAWVGS